MVRSTQHAVRVARVSFESTRLGPQCLAETYARIVPITCKAVRASAKAGPQADAQTAPTRRAEHG
jgi:hypothetical protein